MVMRSAISHPGYRAGDVSEPDISTLGQGVLTAKIDRDDAHAKPVTLARRSETMTGVGLTKWRHRRRPAYARPVSSTGIQCSVW